MSGHDGRVWLRLRTQRFDLRADTPIWDLIERDAQILGRTDVFKAVVCRGARSSWRVLLAASGRTTRRRMPKPTESPLRFAPVCFPPCFPGCRARGGEAENDPEGPF